MNALDTNILARFFIDDENDLEAIKQKQIVTKIFSQPSFVPLTVILEFVWVMKKGYQLPKETIADILNVLCNTSHISVEHGEQVQIATRLFLQGMDFADALHLSQSHLCDKFYTFDKRFINKACLLCPQSVVVAP